MPMKPLQGRNVHLNQATRSTTTNKPGKEQSTTSSMTSLPNMCVHVPVRACVFVLRMHPTHSTQTRLL